MNRIIKLIKHFMLHLAVNAYFSLSLDFYTGFSKKFLILYIFQGFMIIIPVIYRYLDNQGYFHTARILALTAYNWMGYQFLFFFTSLVVSIIISLLRVFSDDIGYEHIFPYSAVIAVLLMIYGFYEASQIRVNRLGVHVPSLDRDYDIVQISDLHLSLVASVKRIRSMYSLIDDISPDIIISSGDLVDGNLDRLEFLIDELGGIKATIGKYAVTGNHEYYNNIDKALEYTKRAGFRLLEDESVMIDNNIRITGMDDNTVEDRKQRDIIEEDLLDHCGDENYHILVKHRPVIRDESIDRFSLQLSGHTHRGSIYPMNYIVGRVFKYDNGLYDLTENCSLFVSNGVGTWGPSFRFLAPPEITHIRLSAERYRI
ncbi:MAG: metallophosphoesterase [Candidatus Muiribacteriaceae bacterium]